jgi:hypothetical protein
MTHKICRWKFLINFCSIGGPTGVELSGEIFDLINQDLVHAFPTEAREAKVCLHLIFNNKRLTLIPDYRG